MPTRSILTVLELGWVRPEAPDCAETETSSTVRVSRGEA
jgi:hypothetical protein